MKLSSTVKKGVYSYLVYLAQLLDAPVEVEILLAWELDVQILLNCYTSARVKKDDIARRLPIVAGYKDLFKCIFYVTLLLILELM